MSVLTVVLFIVEEVVGAVVDEEILVGVAELVGLLCILCEVVFTVDLEWPPEELKAGFT